MKILAIILLVSWLTGLVRLIVGLHACFTESDQLRRYPVAVEDDGEPASWTRYWPNETYELGTLPSEQGRLTCFTELYEPPEHTSLSEDAPYYDWSSSSDY